jgi:hypothetical protein
VGVTDESTKEHVGNTEEHVENMEEHVGNPINSLALVKRLTVEFEQAASRSQRCKKIGHASTVLHAQDIIRY